MRIKSKIVIPIILIIFLSVFILSCKPSRKEFVTNMTIDRSEDLFFEYEITRYPSNVEIGRLIEEEFLIGFTIDPWNLNFGIVPKGGSYGKRFVTLENLQDKDAKVKFDVHGNITPLVSFSRNNFILNTNKGATIDVFLRTKNTTKIGNYTGEIDVVVVRPKYDFLYYFLGWI